MDESTLTDVESKSLTWWGGCRVCLGEPGAGGSHRDRCPVPAADARIRELEDAIRAYIEPVVADHTGPTNSDRCSECGHPWPCPDRALYDAL